MVMNVAEELKIAKARGYAIGAFNTNNLEVTKAICAAAKEFDFPIFIQTSPSATKYAGLKQIFDIVNTEIAENGIKAAIHLDHGDSFEIAKACLDIGYPSVMIDGSKLSYTDNVALTRQVVEYAHERGAAVEAEIGVLAVGEISEGGESQDEALSSPEQTAEFVKVTGIDSVAVAIGNVHGAPTGEKIDLPLLKRIADIIEIPLVMHGSSGLSDDDVNAAISYGVAKFNVDTRIRRAFMEAFREDHPEEKDYRDVLKRGMVKGADVVRERISFFTRNAH